MQRQATGYGYNLPITPQTDQRNYPPYEFREYPKMLTVPARKEDIDEWRRRNQFLDTATREVSYNGAAPKLGTTVPLRATQDDVDAGFAVSVGDELIAANKEDEKLILQSHGLLDAPAGPKIASIKLPTAEEVQAQNAEMEALLKRNAALRKAARLQAEDAEDEAPAAPVRRRRRKRGAQAKPQAPVLLSELP